MASPSAAPRSINVGTTVSEHKADYLYRVDARVTDLGKREITGKGWIVATYGSFVLNATPDRYFYAPGSAATVTVEARDYDSKPVATAFHIKVSRYNIYDRQFGEVKAATGGSVGANGQGTVSLNVPADGGSYRIEATARTPEGRDVQGFAYFWVSGGAPRRSGNGRKEIQIIPDKKTYRAGDTAKLLLVTSTSSSVPLNPPPSSPSPSPPRMNLESRPPPGSFAPAISIPAPSTSRFPPSSTS